MCTTSLCPPGGSRWHTFGGARHVWTWGQPWPPGDIKQISTPVQVQGLEHVRLIAVGAFHNLALHEHGEIRAWGNNEYGQLGTGDTQPRALPIAVKGLDGLFMVYAWGRGVHGRLGLSEDRSSKLVPQKVELLAGETITQVSCGETHSVALSIDGHMFSFGRAENERLGYEGPVATGYPIEVPVILPPKNKGVSATNGRAYPHSDSTDEHIYASGSWCVKHIACGGRHTLVLATWEPEGLQAS